MKKEFDINHLPRSVKPTIDIGAITTPLRIETPLRIDKSFYKKKRHTRPTFLENNNPLPDLMLNYTVQKEWRPLERKHPELKALYEYPNLLCALQKYYHYSKMSSSKRFLSKRKNWYMFLEYPEIVVDLYKALGNPSAALALEKLRSEGLDQTFQTNTRVPNFTVSNLDFSDVNLNVISSYGLHCDKICSGATVITLDHCDLRGAVITNDERSAHMVFNDCLFDDKTIIFQDRVQEIQYNNIGKVIEAYGENNTNSLFINNKDMGFNNLACSKENFEKYLERQKEYLENQAKKKEEEQNKQYASANHYF